MKKITIDTTDKNITKISLKKEGVLDEIRSEKLYKSQNALLLIDKILKRNRLKPKDLEAIEVEKGPGSFTGVRVGIAIANALGFSLKKPVNGGKTGEIAQPKYK